MTAVTVAGLSPSWRAICARAIGPEEPISLKIAARLRSRLRPVEAVR